jgi:hypothetical protein
MSTNAVIAVRAGSAVGSDLAAGPLQAESRTAGARCASAAPDTAVTRAAAGTEAARAAE